MSKISQVESSISKISAQFQEQPHVRLLGKKSWVFPLQLAEIQMKTVVRSQMDVLMKMILKILDRLEVKLAREISELLAVETIFVEHMLELMMQNKMVAKMEDTFQLTTSGLAQLTQGTFEHDPTEEQVEITYSPLHHDVLNLDIEHSLVDDDEEVPNYEFEKDVNMVVVDKLDDSKIRQMIEGSGYEFLVEKGQILIEEILSVELKENLRPICFEFHLYDKTEDIFFVRVWNTWTGKFDVHLESEINHNEAVKLRKQYNL